MANNDSAQYTLRFNEITGNLEFGSGSNWTPTGISDVTSGVTSFNTLTGAVTISAGSGITLTPSGNNIAIASTGSGITPSVQVLQTTATQTTSSSYIVTALTSAFALSNAAHKVKITFNAPVESVGNGNAAFITVFQDGTDLDTTGEGLALIEPSTDATTNATVGGMASASILAVPGDTTSHTYAVYIKNSDGTNIVTWNSATGTAVMILEEIV